MKKALELSLALAVILAAASAAHASSFLDANLDCGNDCDGPPVAARASVDGFSLSLAENLFQNGVAPTIDQLTGTWTLVGIANVRIPDPNLSNAYDVNGVKNADGSSQFSLEIQQGHVTGQDFSGNPITQPASVTLLNLGQTNANQGPNDISFDPNSSAACFAQYTYDSRDETLDKSHGNYECRLLESDSRKMICSVALIIDPSEVATSSDADKAWNGKVETYFAYVKK